MMGKWHRHRELEVYITTLSGEQHLRLHGWLKRNDVLVKTETIPDNDDHFGVFMVYITENQLNKLRDQNKTNSLFLDLEVMSTESERWNIFQGLKKDSLTSDIEKIQDFMFSFQIRDKADIQKFLTQANETSLALFKKNNDFIKDYVETSEMTKKDKLKDLELMIEAFVEEERYEDCALLVKIKNKVVKFYEKSLTKK